MICTQYTVNEHTCTNPTSNIARILLCVTWTFKKNKGGYAAVRRTQWRLLNCNYWVFSGTEASWKRVLMLSQIVQLATFNQLKSTCKDSNNRFLVQRAPWWKVPVSESAFSHWGRHRSVFFSFLSPSFRRKKRPASCLLGRFFLFLSLKGYFFPSHFADDISTHTKSLVLGIVPK